MGRRAQRGGPLLLAPAGSRQAVEAALSAGADAVYVGLRGWSRGEGRAGLPAREIPGAASDCRRAGAELHVALNTVPSASEIPAFLSAARACVEAGAHTLILNDPGAIALVRGGLPESRICASVGVSTLNPGDAVFYRELGADAVVLPTAVPSTEVRAIKEPSGLFIEAFLLCRAEVILQGRCALSGYAREADAPEERPALAAAGIPSSSKRGGRCFLVCRTLPVSLAPWSIEEELSTWISAGVDAFKVQGRDLSPDKLAPLIRRLRGRLDEAIERAAAAPIR